MAFEEILQITRAAKAAAREAANLRTPQKDAVLRRAAEHLIASQPRILEENQMDLRAAEAKGLSKAMLDRLTLNEKRVAEMAQGLREIVELPDPVGQVVKGWTRPNGLRVEKVRIPLGVIAIIYESRPNVTVDAAGLCLKSGNVVVLRGGSEAIHSNRILGEILRESLQSSGVNPDLVQVVPTTDREALKVLLEQDREVDLVIPRGGEGLMKLLREISKIPVIKHDKGVCHIFVDYNADLDRAEKIVLNAKVQRPGVCNALETLLVDRKVAHAFLPRMAAELQRMGVELRGDAATRAIVPQAAAATEADWDAEYLDLILAVKVVEGLDEALAHIERHGSLHTESILTNDEAHAERFLREVNASAVMVNASTRFNDGGQLGLGAEIGISTTKLHAFGPMGLEELTTQKYVVRGDGQVRE
ncbi:glutamate-5-semialdehyde dehydrogenase [Deltaproteobacteria bacterium PRO3]|nr:glutamate-5-semialdehyde dehydrogenase [Deltaproteobacteria bacterium PRO3]